MVTPERLAALFKDYHAPLVRFLTRRLGDRDSAEEIAQETFVRALKQETIASERSWLFAVASNLVRDEARRESRERKRHDLMRARAESESPVEQEPTAMERAEDQALARQAIDLMVGGASGLRRPITVPSAFGCRESRMRMGTLARLAGPSVP